MNFIKPAGKFIILWCTGSHSFVPNSAIFEIQCFAVVFIHNLILVPTE